jgi:hypothetical protein
VAPFPYPSLGGRVADLRHGRLSARIDTRQQGDDDPATSGWTRPGLTVGAPLFSIGGSLPVPVAGRAADAAAES